MHLRGCSKHIALRVCFIQYLILDGLINVKQWPITAQIADIGNLNKRTASYTNANFTDQIFGDKHVATKDSSFGLS